MLTKYKCELTIIQTRTKISNLISITLITSYYWLLIIYWSQVIRRTVWSQSFSLVIYTVFYKLWQIEAQTDELKSLMRSVIMDLFLLRDGINLR